MLTDNNLIAVNDLNGGIQRKYLFRNGYGASVIKSPYSYGGSDGLWEIAVLGKDGKLCYDTPITDDVIGYLDDYEVNDILTQIEEL